MNLDRSAPDSRARRRFLGRAALGLAGVAAVGAAGWGIARPRLVNPCHASLPAELAGHSLVRAAWAGIEPGRVWDCHAHIAGTGDSGSGVRIAREMQSLLHPVQFAQRLFYLNAGCAHDAPGRVDRSYVERMHNLVDGLQPGAKLMLFAFDHVHDESGQELASRSAFYVPNAYARDLARRHPAYFEWVCSVHPYRRDAVAQLEAAAADGARAVKWLPSAMGIDPASPKCAAFHAALARLKLPLITHAGEERAVHGAGSVEANNPLRLRQALDAGVRVVVAHCASIGEDVDYEHGGRSGPRVPSFALFERLMAEPAYVGRLFADISAITQRNRSPGLLRTLLERREWHPRLLNGSDYPLPGVLPLFSPGQLVQAGLLAEAAAPVLAAIQDHNPLLFDFVLKRSLRSGGARFPESVFHTRDFFVARPA